MKKEEIDNNNHLLVGITGAIGSGKTSVSNIIRELGYVCLDADQISRNIINTNEAVRNAIVNQVYENAFINDVYQAKEMANIVFNDANALARLNSIVHPYVIEELMHEIDSKINKNTLLFCDIPLLYELNLDEGFDYVICVYANDLIRQERVLKRHGVTAEEFINRDKNQIKQDLKKANADFCIVNEGTLNDLLAATKNIVEILKIIAI